MLKVKIYKNNFYSNRQNLHVQIPKRFGFPDNCLVLTETVKKKYVLFQDNGEIFRSINQSKSRINPPIYRHGLNKYSIAVHSNLQILASTDLANLLFTGQPTRKQIDSVIMEYVNFIKKLAASGMTFKYVY